MIGTVALVAAFVPFVLFAARDNVFHARLRRVRRPEHLLHAALAISIAVIVAGALTAQLGRMLIGLGGLAIFGALDEFVFHRAIPAEEHDVHAKEHFALLMFVACALGRIWLHHRGALG